MTTTRTEQRPMAFTAWEFIRGALLTYVFFLPLTLIPFSVMFGGGLVGPGDFAELLDPEVGVGIASLWVFMLLPSATWGLAALVPAALGALAIGLALRPESRTLPHALAHGGWGLIVGLVVSSLVLGAWSFGGGNALAVLPTVAGFGLAVAIAAALAWWTTASLALRRDARIARGMQEARTG